MAGDDVKLNRFIVQLLDAQYRSLKQVTEALTAEHLSYQLTPDTNSIGELLWHLSRWRHLVMATVTRTSQVWGQAA